MSPLAERAVSLFGEIAVAAGVFEAKHKRPPRYVWLSTADASVLRDYIRHSDATLEGRLSPGRAMAKQALVSGLMVRVWSVDAALHVC